MKKTIFTYLCLLSMLLPARAQSTLSQEATAQTAAVHREAIVAQFPLIQNDSIEQGLDYLYQEGLNYYQQGDLHAGMLYMKDCLRIDSTFSEAWFNLAPIYRAKNQMDSVLICLENAYRYAPENKAFLLNLASAYTHEEKFLEAAGLLETYLKNYPQDYSYYFYLSEIYGQVKLHEESIRVLKNLENIIGKNEEISMEIYNHYRALGKVQNGIKEIELLAASDTNNDVYQLLMAYAYEDYAPQKATKLYRKYMKEGIGKGKVEFLLAQHLLNLGKISQADKIFQQIMNSKESDFEQKVEVATSYYLKYHASDSLYIKQILSQLAQDYPKEEKSHLLYAAWLGDMKDFRQAAVHYNMASEINPSNEKLWQLYLTTAIQLNDTEMVKSVCSRARVYFPKEMAYTYYLATTHLINKDYPKSLQYYRECIPLIPIFEKQRISSIYGSMGDVYHQMNQMDSCYLYYDKALETDADNALVLNNYAYFLALDGHDLDKAEKMSRKAIDLEASNATYLDTYAWVCFKRGYYSMAKIYIERALLNEEHPSAELIEHYGDILWFCEDKSKAVEQWKLAKLLSEQASQILLEKVKKSAYVE